MKKIYTFTLIFLSFLSFCSCEKEEMDTTFLEVDTQFLNFGYNADLSYVNINASQTPKIKTSSWISASLLRTDKNANEWRLTIRVSENKSDSERNGEVTISFQKEFHRIYVSQVAAAPDEKISTTEDELLKLDNKSCLYSIKEENDGITVTYLEDWIPGNAPELDDFKNITVDRSLISRFTNSSKYVRFQLNSGKNVTLNVVDAPMTVTLDKERIESDIYNYTDGGYNSAEINFTINCPRPDKIKVYKLFPKESVDVYMDGVTVKGTVRFETRGGTEENMLFSNGITEKEIAIPCEYTDNVIGIKKDELKDALIALYNACNGKEWPNQENWLTNDDVTTWEGVRVSNINLLEVNGHKMPVSLFYLNLYSNKEYIKGIIPEEFWNVCKWCRNIDLDGADLSGTVVPKKAWGKFLHSLHLCLTGVQISLDDAMNSPNITHIVIDGNKVKAPTEAFFDFYFPELMRIYATFDKPSPIVENVANFKTNAPELRVLHFENVSDYPENIMELTQLWQLSINRVLYIYKEGDYSIFG